MAYVIPSYSLAIKKEDLEELRNDVWNDDPVPGYLTVENKIYDVDIAYRGSYTREFRKKSYWLDFIEPEEFNGSREIHLNAGFKDPSLIRNKLSLDFFQDIRVLSPESQHINLTLNGSVEGVYLQLESVDDLFLQKRGLPEGPIYYAINNYANFSFMRNKKVKKEILSGYEQKVGNWTDDFYLQELITKINTTPINEFPEIIERYIHIENYLRWLSGAVCTMNNDGFTHNYALYRNSQTGLFEILPWDYDATWGRKVNGGVMEHDYVPIEGKLDNHLSFLLLQIPEYRKRYRSILEEILETRFTVDYLEEKIVFLHQALRPHILHDPYKKKSIHSFDDEPDFILQFIKARRSYLINQLKNLEN
ncbi:CotH kinase family protein [Bacillus sp. BRMEA1]|uniref:CotH kinase family protein n=1 Tax=Neobacillus endophyticus TaxID=2738405 RepID=UPI0015652BEA|nr:CotH kinase family protein [Neobacillus endophyticus]NRD76717.1 CotH kinase family protein [Neobacillus endophyticus]